MPSLFDLTGKTALLTGSGRGIGLELARALAAAGARIVINDINPEAVSSAVSALRAEGAEAHEAVFDVTDCTAVECGVEKVEMAVGAIDILVNNAGVHRRAPLASMSEADWRLVLDTNLTAAFFTGRSVAQRMTARGAGKIVNICSINAERPRPEIGNYSAAKGGLVLLTRAMCVEWARHNIQVNSIAPGYIVTEMTMPLARDPAKTAWIESITPARRWGTTKDLAGAAVFLASEASDFVNGHILYVDGGMRYAL